MFQFLVGVAVGAAGYWAWQSFGRDLLGMGGDQGESTYGGFSSSSGGTSFGSSSTAGGSMGSGTGTSSGGTTTSGSGAGLDHRGQPIQALAARQLSSAARR